MRILAYCHNGQENRLADRVSALRREGHQVSYRVTKHLAPETCDRVITTADHEVAIRAIYAQSKVAVEIVGEDRRPHIPPLKASPSLRRQTVEHRIPSQEDQADGRDGT